MGNSVIVLFRRRLVANSTSPGAGLKPTLGVFVYAGDTAKDEATEVTPERLLGSGSFVFDWASSEPVAMTLRYTKPDPTTASPLGTLDISHGHGKVKRCRLVFLFVVLEWLHLLQCRATHASVCAGVCLGAACAYAHDTGHVPLWRRRPLLDGLHGTPTVRRSCVPHPRKSQLLCMVLTLRAPAAFGCGHTLQAAWRRG